MSGMNHIAFFLKDIFLNQMTGKLVVRTAEDQRIFYFQDGVLLYAKTDAPGEELLDILIKLGHVTLEQADQLGLQMPAARSLGEDLLERGLIDKSAFFEALMTQAREAILNAFASFGADVVFQEMPPFQAKGLESNLSLPHLIADGLRLMPFHPQLQLFFEGKVPTLRGEMFMDYLQEEEKKLLAMIDGRLEAEALLEACGMEPEIFWKTLFLFFCLDLMDLRPAEAVASRSPSAETPASGANLLAEVQIMKEALGSIDMYHLLNVPSDAGVKDIKRAYFDMARKFHPDAFGGDVTPEERQSIFEVFNALNRAYQTLTARAQKKAGTTHGAAETVLGADIYSVIQQAEDRTEGKPKAGILFRKGQKLYDEGKFGGAAAMFQEAVHLDAQCAEYHLWLARSESKVPTLVKMAEKDYQQASRLDPGNPEPLVGLGLLYKNEGLLNLAAKQFEKAVEIDPSHPVVRRELESLKNSGRGKKKGLFGFKK
jgi:tetratricopeptide (TPR) repeat protein